MIKPIHLADLRSMRLRLAGLLVAAMMGSAPAQAAPDKATGNLDATALNDLVAVGAALEFGRFCGKKESDYPEIVRFKSLAEKSYVLMMKQSATEVKAAFEEGKAKAQTAKAEFTKQRCTQEVLPTLKEYDASFKSTNATLVKLMSTFKGYNKKQ